MDLRPYGIDLVLDPSTDLLTIDKSKIASAQVRRKKRGTAHTTLDVDGIPYEIIESLGEGTFGIVYKGRHEGKLYAIKEIFDIRSPSHFHACVLEIIIHILLLHESMDLPHGPYVPYLYKVGFDFSRNVMYLVTEMMDDTFEGAIQDVSKEANDVLVPYVLARLATILELFGNRLHFNHRDLHTGNIMLSADLHRVVLIDFGYACLTWKNLLIQGPSLYDTFPAPSLRVGKEGPCFKVDRDLAFVIFAVYKFYSKYLSASLLEALRKPLQTTVGSHKCDMGAMCPEYGLKALDDHYEFLDRENVVAQDARPNKVRQQMTHLLSEAKMMRKIITPCAPNSVRNPKTRRCVKRTGRIGTPFSKRHSRRALVLSAKVVNCADKPGHMYNVRTEKCVPIKDTSMKSL